ncbi:MAG: N-acetylmuramoyl-L-alanine amidase [Syntrophales bacterium]|nr:N-acetylmuramoyl-L-alanine amidase [Syntrophales bacterium]
MNQILNVRHWVAPDHTRIVIDTSETPDYTVEKSKEHIRIDFKNSVFPKNLPKKLALNKPGVTVISMVRLSGEGVRVEILLADHLDANVFKLPKIEEKPDRVVVDIELPEGEKKEVEERGPVTKKNRIVVIDPGHGGDDPGAVGPRGTQEKDVVLKIGKRLRDKLNKREGYRAFLTRNGDYYVPFSKRLKIAREYGADLFLSIHADAAPNRRAHGASVYCLSIRGASTEAARLLAMKENLADMMGGSPNGESNEASDPIVLNMYQTNTINTSKIYGQTVMENIGRVMPLKFVSVQSAPFRVLKLPEIPSLLVETGYISNKREEKLLRSRQHQKRIADAIAAAVVEMLPVEPAMEKEPEVREVRIQYYQVKRGDTLGRIAKKHNTSLAALLKLNQMKLKDPLYVDRKVKIAVPDENTPAVHTLPKAVEASVKPQKAGETDILKEDSGIRVYRVQKGDTLAKIAKKHGTPLNVLLKINKMKLRDPIFAGRVIKIKDRSVEKETTTVVKKGSSIQKKKGKFIYHRVKKGETLDIIARRNGTTIGELRQLNRMKPSDPLLADQKLKLPLQSSL